ncbi:MAG: hypothetical protein TU36_003700 [Vulcanisaeta sp. AZ3]
MKSSVISDDITRRLLEIVGEDWVSIREIENILRIKITLETLNRLSRSRVLEVMYNTFDETFYLRRKRITREVNAEDVDGGGSEGEGKLNLQRVVEKMRDEFRGMVPKPEFEDWLSSNVNGNWRLVYNQLLNDDVIEEVIVSGMVFVKVINE